MELKLKAVNTKLEQLSAFEIINWMNDIFSGKKIKLSTSFGAEGIVILDMLYRSSADFEIFTIDTCRNFNETYEIWQVLQQKYGINITTYYPCPEKLRKLVEVKGPNPFYSSVNERKECCAIRKIEPLKRALSDADLWISGIRRLQSSYRSSTEIIEWNKSHSVYKLAPLAKWSEENVWEYTRNNNLPYNKLYDKGFKTIGCEPCTRPERPAEKSRSCRWWWEDDAQKECGIHFDGEKLVRSSLNWSI